MFWILSTLILLIFIKFAYVIWCLEPEQAESYADGCGHETSSHSFWWNNWLSSPISHHLCMHESWIAITCDFVAMSTEEFDYFYWICNYFICVEIYFFSIVIFWNVFDAECGIHKDVIYRCLLLIVKTELPYCNYEVVWCEVEGMLTWFPTCLSLFSHVSSASF